MSKFSWNFWRDENEARKVWGLSKSKQKRIQRLNILETEKFRFVHICLGLNFFHSFYDLLKDLPVLNRALEVFFELKTFLKIMDRWVANGPLFINIYQRNLMLTFFSLTSEAVLDKQLIFKSVLPEAIVHC